MEENTLQWVQDTLNREIRQFVFEIVRGEQLTEFNFEKYLEPIQLKIPDEHRPTRKIPKQHQRCQARIHKNGREEQCSHRSCSNIFCLTHAKTKLKYGLITDPIPPEHQHLFRYSPDENHSELRPTRPHIATFSDGYMPNFDISLIPLGKQYLRPLEVVTFGGKSQILLEDPVTKYLYTNDKKPKYIGQIANGFIIR